MRIDGAIDHGDVLALYKIDQLLARNEDYAANWVPFWEEALCSEGGHQGGVKPRGNHRDWIFDSFKTNKPYDVFVSELIVDAAPTNPPRGAPDQPVRVALQNPTADFSV